MLNMYQAMILKLYNIYVDAISTCITQRLCHGYLYHKQLYLYRYLYHGLGTLNYNLSFISSHQPDYLNKVAILSTIIQGRMQDFSGGGGPNFRISGILDIHAAKRHVSSSEHLLGGFGGMPPQEFF